VSTERFKRQSFLGANSQDQIARTVIGVVGLGGGGSHIVQQLAHIGFQNFVLYDDDVVEDSNLNRLIGGTAVDERSMSQKLYVARRMIFGLQPQANVVGVPSKWQQDPSALQRCNIVFGCMETLLARSELEVFTRRYLIHYIDIGMDVHGDNPPVIGGQVVLSSPDGPCMRCVRFLTDEGLTDEAARYGDAGDRPQVVWPNGVLASTAVGIAIDLVTGWTRKRRNFDYLVYDGTRGTVKPSLYIQKREFGPCPHFPTDAIGDPRFTEL